MGNSVVDLVETSSGFQLQGTLTFEEVGGLYERGLLQLTKQTDAIEVDLSGAVFPNSAGLALLLDWVRSAKQMGKEIRFVAVPAGLNVMAELYGIDGFIDLQQAKSLS